jgi:hypothetical protein
MIAQARGGASQSKPVAGNSQSVGFASVNFESASAPSEASEHRQKFGHLRVQED